jgi:Domain of unknown function (DUF4157)
MGASVGYQSSKATIVTRGHEGAPRGVARTPLQSAASSTLALSVGWTLLRVQRACGYGGGGGLEDESINLATMQPSPTVSTPGDPFELEADRVADQVMRMPASSAKERSRISQLADTPSLHRACAACAADNEMSSVVARGISDGGRSLDSGTRNFMESRFGRDFGHVRVHTVSNAAESARSLDALAYTVGNDILFGAGQYSPHTKYGRRVIAHELAHIVQQRTSGDGRVGPRRTTPQSGASGAAVMSAPSSRDPVHNEQDTIRTATTRAKPFQPKNGFSEAANSAPVLSHRPVAALVQRQVRRPQVPGGAGQRLPTGQLCFSPGSLLFDLGQSTNLFGSVAELLIEAEYCKQMRCDQNDYFDNSVDSKPYTRFLEAHNPHLSTDQILTIRNTLDLNRPDILTHKSQRVEYYEIKPKGQISEGARKLGQLEAFYEDNSMPYRRGSAYSPKSEIPLASISVMGARVEVFLSVEKVQRGLLVYELCIRGAGLVLSPIIITVLLTELARLLGRGIKFPPIDAPPMVPAPEPIPVQEPAWEPGAGRGSYDPEGLERYAKWSEEHPAGSGSGAGWLALLAAAVVAVAALPEEAVGGAIYGGYRLLLWAF